MRNKTLYTTCLLFIFTSCCSDAATQASLSSLAALDKSIFTGKKPSLVRKIRHRKLIKSQSCPLISYEKLTPPQRLIVSKLIGLIRGGNDNLEAIFNLVNRHPNVMKWKDQDDLDPLSFAARMIISTQVSLVESPLKFDRIFTFLLGITATRTKGRAFNELEARLQHLLDVEKVLKSEREAFFIDAPLEEDKGYDPTLSPIKLENHTLMGQLKKDKKGNLEFRVPSKIWTAYGEIETRWLMDDDTPIPTGVFVGGVVPINDSKWKEKQLSNWRTFLHLQEKAARRRAIYFMEKAKELKKPTHHQHPETVKKQDEPIRKLKRERAFLKRKLARLKNDVQAILNPKILNLRKEDANLKEMYNFNRKKDFKK